MAHPTGWWFHVSQLVSFLGLFLATSGMQTGPFCWRNVCEFFESSKCATKKTRSSFHRILVSLIGMLTTVQKQNGHLRKLASLLFPKQPPGAPKISLFTCGLSGGCICVSPAQSVVCFTLLSIQNGIRATARLEGMETLPKTWILNQLQHRAWPGNGGNQKGRGFHQIWRWINMLDGWNFHPNANANPRHRMTNHEVTYMF